MEIKDYFAVGDLLKFEEGSYVLALTDTTESIVTPIGIYTYNHFKQGIVLPDYNNISREKVEMLIGVDSFEYIENFSLSPRNPNKFLPKKDKKYYNIGDVFSLEGIVPPAVLVRIRANTCVLLDIKNWIAIAPPFKVLDISKISYEEIFSGCKYAMDYYGKLKNIRKG